MSVAAFQLQQKRRFQQREAQSTFEYIDRQQTTEHVNRFERKGEGLNKCRVKDEIAQRLIKKETERLQQRKNDLEKLYQKEQARWASRVEESIKNDKDQKVIDMRTRALRLKELRERERKQFVKDSLERQWRRDGQDELRSLHSKEQVSKQRGSFTPGTCLLTYLLHTSTLCTRLNKQVESNMCGKRSDDAC